MNLSSEQTVAMIIGTSFAAGLNVYATVGFLGLPQRGPVRVLEVTVGARFSDPDPGADGEYQNYDNEHLHASGQRARP